MKSFVWDEECDAAFEQMKIYLGKPPLLCSPVEGEELFVYLAASDFAVAAVLVREEGGVQRPIYYVSKALRDIEARYFNVEKLAYALVVAARKLRAYFVAHTIVVLSDAPLRKILQQPDAAGRLLKWSIELTEFDLRYESHRAIKAQALADFIVETSFTRSQAELVEDAVKKRAGKKVVPSLVEEKERPPDCWIYITCINRILRFPKN